MLRRLVPVLAAVVAAVAAGIGAGAPAAREPATPRLDRIAAPLAVAEGRAPRLALRGGQPVGSYGGAHTTRSGEIVTVYASSAYGGDRRLTQRWAEFLAALVHGRELQTATLYLVEPREARSICRGGFACYSGRDGLIVAPAEASANGTAPEAIVAHEYGHHVAANRDNAPWPADDYGTKRWASYIDVCARSRVRELRPGATDLLGYARNPAEAFAEAYRILNSRRLGIPDIRETIVIPSLLPDERALELVEEDVLQPWSGNATAAFSGRLARGATREIAVRTPLDGRFRVVLAASAGATFEVALLNVAGWRVDGATAARGRATLRTTICGLRTFTVRVTARRGSGAYRVTVSKP